MECYACGKEASRQCRRCSRLYCELHGGDLCAECLSPTSALPSFNLYRGSLLALLVGTAIAIWLLVRPPGAADNPGVIISEFTPTTIVTQVIDTATPPPEQTPGPDETPGGDGTPDDDETATPEATSTEEPEPTDVSTIREYVVEDGDSLYGIADLFAPSGIAPFDYAQDIADASGLSSVNEPINPGDVLVLP